MSKAVYVHASFKRFRCFPCFHQNGQFEINLHHYQNYFSQHSKNIIQNMYDLAKQIIVYVSGEAKMNSGLYELKVWNMVTSILCLSLNY